MAYFSDFGSILYEFLGIFCQNGIIMPSPQITMTVYMALIILMMLTEDESFTELVHKIKLKDDDISWFEDKKLKNCSLGSLILLVLVRTIQYNMSKLRDQYLHTNCIAALGNLATKLQLLHAYAAQKFMKLFQLFVKKNRQKDMQDDEISVVRNVIKVLRTA